MILILPAALASLFWLVSRAETRREAFLLALILFGAYTAFSTELLGFLHALRPAFVSAAWLLLALGAAAVAIRRKGRAALSPVSRLEWPEWILLGGIVAVAALAGLTAAASAPNSADALSYHLPRVLYWAQSGSVAFFPTPYYNQIMLQPMAEYLVLHTYLLSGGDHFANCVQFLGFCGSVAGVSLIARQLGAARRGQLLAALICATLPNGILQASGAKNDYLLAMWLVCYVYFLLRFLALPGKKNLAACSLALALALFTKGTAYLFAPALTFGLIFPLWRARGRVLAVIAAFALSILAVNGPLYWRNYFFSGSILGYDSAQGDGVFRWRNERPGAGAMVSNALRHVSEQLPARSEIWNRAVYQTVIHLHRWLGLNPSDPATTWPGVQYAPPRNSNHEANGNNKWHLLLFAFSGFALLRPGARRRNGLLCGVYAGILAAFLLFCAYLKWQPFMARLELPLFVLCAVAPAVLMERFRGPAAALVLSLFLLNNSRHFLFENWTRPLRGPQSVLTTPRDNGYFADLGQWDAPDAPIRETYEQAAAITAQSGCRLVGIDSVRFQLEYPFQALLREKEPGVRFLHTGVANASSRYETKPAPRPCAVLCMNCAGDSSREQLYSAWGPPARLHRFLLYLQKH